MGKKEMDLTEGEQVETVGFLVALIMRATLLPG